jgi:restriction system protein
MPDDEGTGEWREQLLSILRNLTPASFERLCQEMLSRAGLEEVTVTGRPGDEGIDGRAIVRFAGFVSLPVVFQCKRYRRQVTAPMIREFRGAMMGRADRGLFVTTGSFTGRAEQESMRDGAPFIDLIDGVSLSEKLRELGIGVTTNQNGAIEVNPDSFANL